MVAVQEQVPVIYHSTALCGTPCIGVRPGMSVSSYIRDKLVHSLGDGISTAECTDDPAFRCRIFLLCQASFFNYLAAGHLCPLGHVLPIPVHGQDAVCAAERVVIYSATYSPSEQQLPQYMSLDASKVVGSQNRMPTRDAILRATGSYSSAVTVRSRGITTLSLGAYPACFPGTVHHGGTAKPGHPF